MFELWSTNEKTTKRSYAQCGRSDGKHTTRWNMSECLNVCVCVCRLSVVYFIFYIDWIIMTAVDKNRRYSNKKKIKKKIFWWQSDWIHFYGHVIQVQYFNDYVAENASLGSYCMNKWFWMPEIESLRMAVRATIDSDSTQLSRFNSIQRECHFWFEYTNLCTWNWLHALHTT